MRFLLAAFLLLASGKASAQSTATAPAWTLQDTDGRVVRLADFRGRVVIFHFWATWCPPCLREIPGFVALQEKYGPAGLTVVGVSMDEDTGAVASFAKRSGINYPVVLGTPLVAALYGGVTAVPTTFVLDRAGKIVALHEGFASMATFAAEIKPLL